MHSVIHEAFLSAIHVRSNNFSDESHLQQANVIQEWSNDMQVNCWWHATGKKTVNSVNGWAWKNQGRSVKTTHIQELYFVSAHKKMPILLWCPNGQIVFYFESPMTFVFCSTKFVVLCFFFRHIARFVFYFKPRLRFSFRF